MTLPTDKPSQSDVSPRALSLARKIDRLPPGVYLIELEKMGNAPTELHRIQRVVTVDVSKPVETYKPE